jgi:hypothetical protein
MPLSFHTTSGRTFTWAPPMKRATIVNHGLVTQISAGPAPTAHLQKSSEKKIIKKDDLLKVFGSNSLLPPGITSGHFSGILKDNTKGTGNRCLYLESLLLPGSSRGSPSLHRGHSSGE